MPKQNRSRKQNKSRSSRKSGGSRSFEKFTNNVENFLNGADNQVGGGFSTDVSQMVAGNPVYTSYTNCTTPVVLDHKLVSSTDCSPVCGHSGGARKLLKKIARKSRRSSKKEKKEKKNKDKKRSASKKTRKARSKRVVKKTKQSGGSLIPGSTPAELPVPGKEGVFTADMTQRSFGCRQPDWEPKCV